MILHTPLINSACTYSVSVSGCGKTGKDKEKEDKDNQRYEVTSLAKQTRIPQAGEAL